MQEFGIEIVSAKTHRAREYGRLHSYFYDTTWSMVTDKEIDAFAKTVMDIGSQEDNFGMFNDGGRCETIEMGPTPAPGTCSNSLGPAGIAGTCGP